MKKLLLFLLTISFYHSYSQSPQDSLWANWQNTQLPDSTRFLAMRTFIVNGYLRRGLLDSSFYFAQQWYDTAQAKGLNSQIATALSLQSTILQMKEDYPKSIEYNEKSFPLFGDSQYDQHMLASGLINNGLMYWELGDYDQATDYYKQALELAIKLKDKTKQGSLLNNLGLVYEDQGDFKNALDYYFKAIKIFEELAAHRFLGNALHNVASIYSAQGEQDKAIEYYNRSLKEREIVEDQEGIAYSLAALGGIYHEEQDYEKAMEYHQRSLEIREQIDHKKGIALSFNSIGLIYAAQNQLSKAKDFFKRSLDISREIGNKEGIIFSLKNFGKADAIEGNTRQAISYLEQALKLAQEVGLADEIQASSLELSKSYKREKRYAEALEMHELYVQMKDSILSEENTKALLQQQMQYDYEQKVMADSLAFVQEKAKTEIAYQGQLNRRNYLLFGGLAVALLGFLLLRFLQQRKEKQRLEQIDQLKDQFLANTSHELRTPLNGIIGITESLLDKVKNEEFRYNLELVVTSGKRLASLVNDLLDFSRIRNADLVLQQKPVDLYSLVNVIIRLSQSLIQGKDLVLDNQISPDLSPVFADENRLTQVLHNVIGNAIKFTERGRIEIKASVKDHMIEVSVSDTGIGIPQEKHESIFEAFTQADGSISRTYSGTGLGLSISKALVNKHGGDMWVNSEEGKGSVFFFTLPLSKEKPVKQSVGSSFSSLTPLTTTVTPISKGNGEIQVKNNLERGKILIVDDEPINHQVLKNHLSKEKFEVFSAMNGDEAIQLIEKENNFDLVLLDVMMPRMSGYQVCETIREKHLPNELPIIMVTAKNQVRDLVEGFNTGANDYLAKPFSKDELLARLNTHLNLHQINQATSRFVPEEFIQTLGKSNITQIHLGDNTFREVTVFFSDIRGYTTLAEGMIPEENFHFVNAYANRMGPIIQQHKGFVNQYLGDGIMALFQKSPADAVRASIAMQAEIRNYNIKRAKDRRIPLKVGMGMHAGPLVMGIIGDQQRSDTAIISDTVNTAARLEGLTKYYGANIIISDPVFKTLSPEEQARCRYLGLVQLKGKYEPLGIYEPLDGDTADNCEAKLNNRKDFQAGLDAYLQGDLFLAREAFSQIINQNPNDGPSQYFLNRVITFSEEGLPEGWKGVEEMDNK